MWRRTKQGKESVRRDHLHREQTESSQQSASIIGFNVQCWRSAQDSRFHREKFVISNRGGEYDRLFMRRKNPITFIFTSYITFIRFFARQRIREISPCFAKLENEIREDDRIGLYEACARRNDSSTHSYSTVVTSCSCEV